MVAVASCVDMQEYQQPDTVAARLETPACPRTRSSLPSGIVDRIESATWAVYAQDSGALLSSGYASPGTTGSYEVDLVLSEGKCCNLYAIVNAGDLRSRIPVEERLMPGFDFMLPGEFADLSESGLPMSGKLSGIRAEDGKVTIPLRRLVAEYEVRINLKGLDLKLSENQYKQVMQGRYIQVKNCNRHMSPFDTSGSSARTADDVTSGDSDASFCAIVPAAKATDHSAGHVFSYVLYVPENMQGVLLPDNADPDMKIPEEVDRVNGPGTSDRLTYLEMSLNKTEAADTNPFTGDIIYRMFLGRDNCRDFSIEGGSTNAIEIAFDQDSMLQEPTWKVDHGRRWNNADERLEFSSHDIIVTPAAESSLFVWYSGTGVNLADVVPIFSGVSQLDRVRAAVRDEWFFEEDPGQGDSMAGFSELWASDPERRLRSDAVRYVATTADKLNAKDVVGRYYFKASDSMMGKTAMLVVSDRWHTMRDTCFVHFAGPVTMNSSDFNDFRVAQERILKVSGLPAGSPATCRVISGLDNVTVDALDAGSGRSEKTWTIKALDAGNSEIRVDAGGVSARFTITVHPVFLGYYGVDDGIYCTLDGAHTTCSYAYYADRECRTEVPEGSFVPELRQSLLSPCISLDGPYASLMEYSLDGLQITTYLSSYSSGNTVLGGFRGNRYVGRMSLAPAYRPDFVSETGIFLKSYRSYDVMGNIGTLTDASGYEATVSAKLPDGLPDAYRTHVSFNGYPSFRQFSGSSMVDASGIARPGMWSVGLYTASGDECTSVAVKDIGGGDRWVNADPAGQFGERLTARLKVKNINSGEIFSEDLFRFDSTVLVCIAGGYCNEIGLYGKASLYEDADSPHTFYNSVTGATSWLDDMILIQRDEWNTFVSWGGKIKKYLTYADDFIGSPANVHIRKSKYNLSAGLCFDTYADSLGRYSAKVGSAFGRLCNQSARFITGTVENRNSYVEFDSSAATQLVLLKFHPSLYFGLMAYHSTADRPASDIRKRREVYSSHHWDGVDDRLVPLSQTGPYALRTQVQHVFYGDVEDGLCNDQPWRVDFNHRSPSSLDSWYSNQNIHIPFSPDGDSSVDELIGQFAPELTFSRGANISGLTFKEGDADYLSSDGTHLRMFFLHEVLRYSGSQTGYTWKNRY